MRIFITLCLFSCLSLLNSVQAILTIEITGGREEGGQPIAIVPFAGTAQSPQDIAAIVSSNLSRSGRFAPMPVHNLPEQPSRMEQVHFSTWQMVAIPHLVIGRITGGSVGGYQVAFELFDAYQSNRLLGLSYNATSATLRQVAHQISDEIYKALTGERGVFNTKIVYVTVQRRYNGESFYQLHIADADGANPQTMLKSSEPIFSPTWSPDGTRIAYVTYDISMSRGHQNKQMAIYIQDIRTGKRTRVISGPGINAAPAWSPDSARLALTLSRDGNPEIYVIHLNTRALTRLTHDAAIDTEPDWSPDGRFLVFTSDRSGQPQIYRMSAQGGNAQRLTFRGSYNARPRFSPDGSKLAILHNGGNGYRIGVLYLENGQLNVLTKTSLNESPTFAPNGSLILYGNGSELAAVSIDGGVHQRLSVKAGQEVREPAWSPFNN